MLDARAERELEIFKICCSERVVPGWVKRRYKANDFFDAHPAVHRLIFGEVADAAAELQGFEFGVDAEDADRAVVAVQKAEQHADRCRFAGGVAAEEGECFAAGYLQRDSAQNLGAAERFVNSLDFDCWFVHGLVSSEAATGRRSATPLVASARSSWSSSIERPRPVAC